MFLAPRGIEDPETQTQYEHIKESELKRGMSEEDAERIAVATVNKFRREKRKTKHNPLVVVAYRLCGALITTIEITTNQTLFSLIVFTVLADY